MKIQDFYKEMGVSYASVLQRFMGQEALVHRFLKKFLEDKTYTALKDAAMSRDEKNMFIAAHSLKGVAGNLGLRPLEEKSAQIVELIRAERVKEAFPIVEELTEVYLGLINDIEGM